MAASTDAGASGRGGRRRRVGRGKRGEGRGPGGGAGPLKRLKLAVEEFVQASGEGRPSGGREGPRAERRARPGGRKSRRELRKEKRQLRKARRLQRTAAPGGGAGEGSAPRAKGTEGRAPRPPRPAPPPPRAPTRAAAGSTRPSAAAAAAAARRRALLAANEEEDREIRKLERCLGLHRRRRKGDAGSVPPSFARDGLDYILGALGAAEGRGLCDSSSEDDGPTARHRDAGSEAEDGGDAGSDSEDGGDAGSEAEDGGDAGSDSEDGGDAGSEAEDGGDAGSDSEDGGDAGSDSEDGGDAGSDSADGGDAGSEAEDGAGEQEEEDAPAEEPQKAAAERRAKEKAGGRRVRFAEDEETSENSREDVDAAVQQSLCENAGKYLPPHMLRAEETVAARKREERERLKKHVQGLINRLSEPNLASISGQLEELYMAHSRKDMNDTLTGILMSACAPGTAMPGRLVMEHVLLVSILHRTVGIEVGAHFLEAVVRKFDDIYKKGTEGKECDNLFTIIAHLYNFHVIRFMLETMLALKNNDMRKIPGYDPEPVEKLRKLQRALVRGAGSGTESQLRVSWDSILNAEQTGRWWIVGSAWSGAPMISSQQKAPQKPLAGTVSAKMLELARKQRMNTDVRRNIFCTIMTSEDFLDAFEKLLKLGLKDQQEREIVHVLMDCCLQEKTYNPFYAFLAGKFCDYERRFQMTFQFSIWDKFRDLENLPATNFSNLVYLVAHLLKTKSLPLSILKVIEFSELDKPRVHFLREVLHVLLMGTEAEDLCFIFARVSDNPKLGVLREGLKLFISHFLLKSVQAHRSAEEASALRERAELATKALQGRPSLRM
ncbi:nucleolar MIF4G domain-containing protein 1 isoform X4 [Myotis myotis]|uniref:nucleolar MIF4G domain-containing protein 1 isoform X4 n=1 Tax=Myotis myotis TaxID=51298 RepID=UPI00174CCB15|nr:nucleolar MIF4G domain-containing protein 1 isoform X4 [Myotis myotis]